MNQAEKIDAILAAVKPPALFPELLLDSTEQGPLAPGIRTLSQLYLPNRDPTWGSMMIEIEVVDPVSFRYTFFDPQGHRSRRLFAQLCRIRGADL